MQHRFEAIPTARRWAAQALLAQHHIQASGALVKAVSPSGENGGQASI